MEKRATMHVQFGATKRQHEKKKTHFFGFFFCFYITAGDSPVSFLQFKILAKKRQQQNKCYLHHAYYISILTVHYL